MMSSNISVGVPRQATANTQKSFWKPAELTEARATGQIPFDSISRSYVLMRTFVGILGLALPVILLLGDYFFLRAEFTTKGSLSAYYHSGMRDFFVSILAVTGILLFTYKITERNRDNLFSIIAGIAAICIAIFPTNIPTGGTLTPLQDELGEGPSAFIHYASSAIFIICLGILSYDFANRERKRSQQRAGYKARCSPTFWYRFHLWAAIAIACAVVFIVVTQSLDIFDKHSILIGEIVVTIAFGLSWLFKGLDRDMLPKMSNW